MPVTITNDEIGDIYVKYAYDWVVEIRLAGVLQDLRSDAVTLILKKDISDSDAEAELVKDADVATNGLNGEAVFNLSSDDTDIPLGTYNLEIKRVHAGKPTLLLKKTIAALQPTFASPVPSV